jgi:hypothetical protein
LPSRVPIAPAFFDDPQNPPEEVFAADPLVEVHLEEIDEEVEEADLQEYIALEEEDNAEMDFDGLDITDQKTSAGKEGNARSTRRVYSRINHGKEGNARSTRQAYSRINRLYVTFLAKLDSFEVDLVIKDLYLPGKVDSVNRKLVRILIKWYIQKISLTTSHMSEALMFLQPKLSDATNAVGFIPRKGWIREDPWIKSFMKDMLVHVASSESSQLRDLHADMVR